MTCSQGALQWLPVWGVAILFVSSDVAGRKMRCWSRLQGSRCCIGGAHASLPTPLTSVKTLNGTNFEDWKESLDLYLAITNMDFSLREAEPSALTPESTIVQRASREKWEYSNKVCLMVMRYTMEKYIRQSIPDNDNAKDFMRSVDEKFKTFDKAQKGQYLSLLEKTKYDGVSGVREHMMKLVHYYNKLKSLKVDLDDSYLIWQVMESLPSQFDMLKTSYNTQKEE
ncbi:uncharacterized protein LOC114175406 [Vigna unguiculata]|uniref:uncharacterized protein LOC114175406 n=1 Tax=Vigna unguiculata TaxID=3917 RepID=UPI0010162832|nr:uncharacterized protein LOC114175406 [Vigna unguiculata]